MRMKGFDALPWVDNRLRWGKEWRRGQGDRDDSAMKQTRFRIFGTVHAWCQLLTRMHSNRSIRRHFNVQGLEARAAPIGLKPSGQIDRWIGREGIHTVGNLSPARLRPNKTSKRGHLLFAMSG